MFLTGLGALLVLGGILYMARAAIWRGPLSGPDSSRPVRDTLEPPARWCAIFIPNLVRGRRGRCRFSIAMPRSGEARFWASKRSTNMNPIPQEERCEACFGKGTITLMKPARFGHPIDTSPPPDCPVCKGTRKKPKPD